MSKKIIALFFFALSTPLLASEWMFTGVKILAVEAVDPSNDATRITLDLTGLDFSGNSSFTSCGPTSTAWVVSTWDSPNQEAVLAIALAAQAQDALVDVMVNESTCSTSNTYPVYPYNYANPQSMPVNGLGLKLQAIRMRVE